MLENHIIQARAQAAVKESQACERSRGDICDDKGLLTGVHYGVDIFNSAYFTLYYNLHYNVIFCGPDAVLFQSSQPFHGVLTMIS